jgi:hypothetical protein
MTTEDGVIDADILRAAAPVPVDGETCDVTQSARLSGRRG